MHKAVKVREKNWQNILSNLEKIDEKHIKRSRFEFSFRLKLKK